MNLDKMSKDDFELLSHKDITNLILKEKGAMNTADLFKQIIKFLELPASTFDKKIADYYTTLTTDKRFLLLDDGNWDLRSRHTSDKIKKIADQDEDEEDEELEAKEEETDEEEEDYETSDSSDEDEFDDEDDDLKDLVVLDEEDLDKDE